MRRRRRRRRLFLFISVVVVAMTLTLTVTVGVGVGVVGGFDRQLASQTIMHLDTRPGFLRVRRLEINPKRCLDLEHRVVVWVDGDSVWRSLAVFA